MNHPIHSSFDPVRINVNTLEGFNITIALPTIQDNGVLEFARTELVQFLSRRSEVGDFALNVTGSEKRVCLILDVDTKAASASFSVQAEPAEDGVAIYLRGHDSTGVLHAVYTFLETLGFRFQITGPVFPDRLQMNTINNISIDVQPAVIERGIRQHINFPMDISGYSLDEAKEYIRNLARLRFNAITFHSYPGQWIETSRDGKHELAGSFFYGQRHDIPNVPVLKNHIRNTRTFCIPEMEPDFDDETKRSRLAIGWLADLMAEAKRAGLKVRLSFEPRSRSIETSQTLATVRDILATYPLIDVLEFMTEETGGWGAATSVDELKKEFSAQFGNESLEDPAIAPLLVPDQRDLGILVGQIGHNLRAVRALLADKKTQKLPEIVVGVYAVIPEYLPMVDRLLLRYAPEEVSFALLAGHGAKRVARHMKVMNEKLPSATRTTLYSWLEFDGIMYLQQSGVIGIRNLIEVASQSNKGRQIPGILFNHWRTAENANTARYAALSTLFGAIDSTEFYKNCAHDMGIERVEDFVNAMEALDAADTVATEKLPNVGFSFVGCWVQGVGIGYFANYDPVNLAKARELYETARKSMLLAGGSTSVASGKTAMAFLVNRLDATTVYLRAIEEGVKLKPLCLGRKPEELTEPEREQVLAICGRALELFDEYLTIHVQMMPDRGCEGTLLSVYHTPIAVLRKISVWFGGLPDEAMPESSETADAPVSPILF